MLAHAARGGGGAAPAGAWRPGVPRFLSRPIFVDLLFVSAICGLHVYDVVLAAPDPDFAKWFPLLPSIPATCMLLFRRRWPRAVFAVLMVVTIVLTLRGLPIGALNLAILLAVYSVSVRSPLWEAVLVSVLAMLFPVSESLQLSPAEGVLNVLGALPDLAMIVVLARAIRSGRERRERLEHALVLLDEARDQLAADAATVERARIAREFHDIVSHNLSVVALRAGVARALVDRDPEHARQTLQELETSSRSALGEMRNLLKVLRESPEPEAASGSDRRPLPSLEAVDGLVESVRGGAVSWELDRRGPVRELGSGVEVTAYRVVQEAVTNVLKHATAGRAKVVLEYGAESLGIEVTNHTRGARGVSGGRARAHKYEFISNSSGAGYGLVGLRERVALLGGTFAAHPTTNGFHVQAVLPCPHNSDLA